MATAVIPNRIRRQNMDSGNRDRAAKQNYNKLKTLSGRPEGGKKLKVGFGIVDYKAIYYIDPNIDSYDMATSLIHYIVISRCHISQLNQGTF